MGGLPGTNTVTKSKKNTQVKGRGGEGRRQHLSTVTQMHLSHSVVFGCLTHSYCELSVTDFVTFVRITHLAHARS